MVSKPGEHRWDNVVSDKARFETELFQYIDQAQFQSFRDAMRTDRDKFIAHLDDENIENVPHMHLVKEAIHFYYRYVVANEATSGDLWDLPADLNDYYSACYAEAESMYECV